MEDLIPMAITTHQGSPQFPAVAGSIPPSTKETMDAALQALQEHKDAWVALSNHERIAILDKLINDFETIAPRWVAVSLQAKILAEDSPIAGEEWAAGVWPVLKNLRQLRNSLSNIEAYGRPKIPGHIKTRPDGQVVAQVFPQTTYDRIFFMGVSAEIWMEPGVTAEALPKTQALVYQEPRPSGKVAIVLGTGEEGANRKAECQPLLSKRVTGELGNVSPVIVVPGPWSTGDLAYQAEHIVSMLTNNAGFNCNATRVVIQQREWQQRDQLLQDMRNILAQVPSRSAYYPGARERLQAFIAAHPEAEQYGASTEKELPWTLIAGVNPEATDDLCFTTEPFCSLFSETTVTATSVPEYIDRAVDLANERLWGTLNVTIIVHPASLKDPAIAAALERAVANLRYGTIGVNYWAGAGFALCATTWGAFPGHAINDIQSGIGVVHNTLMFSRPQKSVLRAPFRSTPIPPWFVTRGQTARKVFPKLVSLEASPSPWKVPAILWSAITG